MAGVLEFPGNSENNSEFFRNCANSTARDENSPRNFNALPGEFPVQANSEFSPRNSEFISP